MKNKTQVKTMQEYIKPLSEVAPKEVVDKFIQLSEDGKKIQAVGILRQYKLFDK